MSFRILKNTAPSSTPSAKIPSWATWLSAFLTRKIWLPKILYEGLPYFYALAGFTAIITTLFVSSWYWVLPYCWLLGLLCLHAAIYVWRVRRHYRRIARASAAAASEKKSTMVDLKQTE